MNRHPRIRPFAAFPADGGSRRFPAGTVERVRLDPGQPTLADDPRAWPLVETGTLAAGGTLRLGE